LVVQALQRRGVPAGVRLIDAGIGGMDVMFHVEGAQRVVIIDAAQMGAEVGTLYKVPAEELAALPQPGRLSLHDFRWNHALALGRMLYKDRFPTDISVYLVQVASLDYGTNLTPAVATAAVRLVELLVREIEDAQREAAEQGGVAGDATDEDAAAGGCVCRSFLR